MRTRRRLLLPLVLAGIAGVAVLALVLTEGSDGPGPGSPTAAPDPAGGKVEETRPVTVAGDRLPDLPASGPDPAVGRPLPELRGASFDGQPVAIARDGQPKTIFFLAHWCPHCQSEVPRVEEWLAGQKSPPGVFLYSVSTAVTPGRDKYPPSQWLREARWSVPVLVDDGNSSAALAVGLTGFPFVVFVAADGTVAGRHAGGLPLDELGARMARLVVAR